MRSLGHGVVNFYRNSTVVALSLTALALAVVVNALLWLASNAGLISDKLFWLMSPICLGYLGVTMVWLGFLGAIVLYLKRNN